MTEHVYNELIRCYAGGCALKNVPEKNIDLYIKDAFELFRAVERDEDGTGIAPNIEILNSMVLLFGSALRPDELEAEVLPLFDKYRIKHDVYTFQHISKMYLNLREHDMVISLWDKLKALKIKPNSVVL
jgi:hypothetical protein